MVPGDLTDDKDALTATYKGGAAGRYVTRKLSFTDQGVDPKSPAYHGRFTANAELKAYFGAFMMLSHEVTDPVMMYTNCTILSPETSKSNPRNHNRLHGWRHGILALR